MLIIWNDLFVNDKVSDFYYFYIWLLDGECNVMIVYFVLKGEVSVEYI